jgi:type III pantothenate kinase
VFQASLLIDIGNTRIKWSVSSEGEYYFGGKIVHKGYQPSEILSVILSSLADAPKVVFYISVADVAFVEPFLQAVKQTGIEVFPLRTEKAVLDVVNGYAQYDQLGADRWYAMLAAYHLSRKAVVVVDAGTALTLDFIDASGTHKGGYILPGLQAMLSTLFQTTQLPKLNNGLSPPSLVLARTTQQACLNGVYRAIVDFVNTQTEQIEQECLDVDFHLTGGDAPQLVAHLKRGWLYRDDLVLYGMFLRVAKLIKM